MVGGAWRGLAICSLDRRLTIDRLSGLLAGSVRGDEAAFAELYRETSQQVYNTALRLLCSRVHAEEVTQEVYVQVWQQAGGYDGGKGSVLSWMRVIARRRAVDRIRSVASANARDRQAALLNAELEFEDVWDDVASRIDARRVRPALASLSPVQREAMTLMYFERRTMKEISIQLRLPLGTVKTRIRDGLISLRRTVEQTA